MSDELAADLRVLIALIDSVISDTEAPPRYQPKRTQRAAEIHQRERDRIRRLNEDRAAKAVMAWACPKLARMGKR